MAQETFRNMNQSMNEHIYFGDLHFAHAQPEPCSEGEATLAPSKEAGGLSPKSTAEQQRRRLFFTTHSAQDFDEYDDPYDSLDEVDLTLGGLGRDDEVRFLPPVPPIERGFIQKATDEASELEEETHEMEDLENCEVEILEIQSIALPVTVPSEEVTEDKEEEKEEKEAEEEEAEEEVAVVVRATSNSQGYMSKKDQVKSTTVDEVAAPVVAQQLKATKIELALDNDASRKRKRALDSVETKESEPSSQRAKIVGAALAGMVVGSVGTIFALASM